MVGWVQEYHGCLDDPRNQIRPKKRLGNNTPTKSSEIRKAEESEIVSIPSFPAQRATAGSTLRGKETRDSSCVPLMCVFLGEGPVLCLRKGVFYLTVAPLFRPLRSSMT